MRLILFFCTFFLFGCSSVPQEQPITVDVIGDISSTQFELEDFILTLMPNAEVENQTSNIMTVRNNCTDLKDLSVMKCTLIMMSVGNSGWDGPFLVQNYRFSLRDDKTRIRGKWSWCAINALGKENCVKINNVQPNTLLRQFAYKY